MQLPLALVATLSAAALVHAHIAAFTKGMWCINGSTGDNFNSDDPVLPLYELEFDQWWMHASNGCNQRPPNPGDFLTLPSGDSVVLELASNQAFTSLSYGGRLTSDWPNGQDYPDNNTNPSCITAPNLHTQNQSMAAGTALAISYQSDITKVTPENLAVISVAYNTPFKRLATYQIPDGLPPCPEGGCICGWSWIPNGCGQPNMYFSASRCQVSGNTDSSKSLGSPKPAAWCEGNSTACVKGPKQMLYWHQASGNNIEVSGYDLSGEPKSPAYNAKCGFADGAQSDIFDDEDLSISESILIKSLRSVRDANDSIGELDVERQRFRRARKNIG
ncbi:hypothetical protein DFH05DRAFT_399210 [Lentinula detonsa]|uniref:Uncharacterized protein n=1 Tax=Lentinula detonsa TaxID=2804962 RepID=A0A9W8NT71_9AGAR|nr:hypothetical protein DFH05DRAFT_399210 [Lentinula detonsa]